MTTKTIKTAICATIFFTSIHAAEVNPVYNNQQHSALPTYYRNHNADNM